VLVPELRPQPKSDPGVIPELDGRPLVRDFPDGVEDTSAFLGLSGGDDAAENDDQGEAETQGRSHVFLPYDGCRAHEPETPEAGIGRG